MYQKNKNIVLRNVHDTFFLIDITDNYFDEKCTLYEINDIGAFIWNHLEECNLVEDTVEMLIENLEEKVEKDILIRDMKEYIAVLVQCGFLKNV